MDMVTGDATYTLECDYRVTFIYGSEVYAYWTGTFAYGETPEFPDWYNEPSKGETPKYTYTFKGWKPDVVAMGQHSATYEAEFEEHIRQYSVKFLVGSEEISSEMYDYETPVEKIVVPTDVTKASTAEHSYKFIRWDKDIEPVTKNVMYKAVFEETDRVYVVTFTVDGETVAKGEYAYGTLAKDVAYPEGTPTKEADAQYTYTFFTWCALPVAVTEDITCAAEFEKTVNAYTIAFVVDGKKTEAEYAYGTKAADLKTPETKKAATDQYTYTFKAWDKALADVKAAATYTAVFDSTVKKYMVKFVVDGKVVDSTEYAYGTKADKIKVPEATKKDTKDSTYTFDGWDAKIADVTKAVTYTAKFKAEKTDAIGVVAQAGFKFGYENNTITVVQSSPAMVRVQVFDLTGHLVESFSEQVSGSKEFSLDRLNQGSYMVRVVSKSQIRSARITVR